LELKKDGVKVYGPHKEANKIPGIDVELKGGDEFVFGTNKCKVIDVGGHTIGHIAYHFPAERFAFVGDSLFSLGCGRMFEGEPGQFWESLQRLRELPDDTSIYWYVNYIFIASDK
jgi:hydroxyacylglutathione hydrolase